MNHGIYITNRKALYYFITSEKEESNSDSELISTEQLVAGMGDYFSKPEPTEAQRESLQLLAQKLKEARLKRKEEMEKREKEAIKQESEIANTTSKEDVASKKEQKKRIVKTLELTEKNAETVTNTVNQLISEQKYLDALEILRAINLNNSKKSSYFALQIKYLETILKTTQK